MKHWAEGSPLKFERSVLKKPNKFSSRAEVVEYARRLGVNLEDPDFWSSDVPAVYITEIRKPPSLADFSYT